MSEYKMFGTGPVKVLSGNGSAPMTAEHHTKAIDGMVSKKGTQDVVRSEGPQKKVGSQGASFPKVAPQGIAADGKSVKVEKKSAIVAGETKGKTTHGGKLSHGKAKKA